MNFVQIQSNPEISKFVTGYYFIENTILSHDNIPPLGFPVIQFHLHNNIQQFYSKYDFPIDNVMIVGQLSKYANIDQIEGSLMIGVNLHPTTLYKVVMQSAAIFTDKGTPASLFLGIEIMELYQKLLQSLSIEEKTICLDEYFGKLVQNLKTDRFDTLINALWEKEGKISEEEIYTFFPVSQRTLQRYFIQRIGVSLKTYLRIIRHLNFCKKIQLKPSLKLSELIYECGYYDSSHFTKDFKLMANQSPTEYYKNREEFAHLLIQL